MRRFFEDMGMSPTGVAVTAAIALYIVGGLMSDPIMEFFNHAGAEALQPKNPTRDDVFQPNKPMRLENAPSFNQNFTQALKMAV
jgi:hypothetical protein